MSPITPPLFDKESMISPTTLSNLGLLSSKEWRDLLPVLDGAQGVVTLYDSNLRVVYISPSVTQITGQSTNYYQGKAIGETLSVEPSARMRWESIVTSVLKTGEPFSGELEVPIAASSFNATPASRRWQIAARPLNNCLGDCVGNCACGSEVRLVVVIAHDVTERVRVENALAAHEKRFQRMASNVLGFVYQFAMNTEGAVWFQHFSGNCRAFLGLEEETLRTRAAQVLEETIHPDDYPLIQEKMQRSAEQLSPFLWKGRIFHADRNEWRTLEVFSIPERDEQAGTILWDGLMIDVTERELSLERLRKSEERYRLLAEATDDIVSLHDLERNVLYLSPSFEKVTGYAEEALIQNGLSLLLPIDDLPQDFLARASANNGTTTFEWECKCRDGSLKWLETTVKLLADSLNGPYNRYLCVSHDMTERHHATEALLHQARYDSLTGLPNRRYFTEVVQEAITQAEANYIPLALLLLDIDGFKYINDVLGHDVGDALLCAISERLRNIIPQHATIARLSGDEFTILLPVGEKGVEIAAETAQEIVQCFARPVEVLKHELFITASIGGAVYPQDGLEAATLLRAADRAMHQAKGQGRNTYCLHTEEMNAAAQKRLTMENHLHRAVEKDELSLVFQPQVSLLSGKLVGAEALLRWNNPELGNVPCAQFIPLAEETGLIQPLGEWVLRTACAEAARWQSQSGEPLRISVNISARQLGQPGLTELVQSVLRETGLPPACLELELTESALIWNGPASAFTLQSLKRLGIRLSVDDFGTGYSALSYLRRFPLDAVKIDRTFIQELEQNPQTQAIVRGVVDLSHTLDLEVIAEGVEMVSQRSLLTALGCDAMQGYFFARPLSAHDFVALLMSYGA